MTATAGDMPVVSTYLDFAEFEAVMGDKLKAMWASISSDQLPASLTAAVDSLFDHSMQTSRNCPPARQPARSGSLWLSFAPVEMLVRWRERSFRRSNERMIERAIRKQGIAWMMSDEFDVQVDAAWGTGRSRVSSRSPS